MGGVELMRRKSPMNTGSSIGPALRTVCLPLMICMGSMVPPALLAAERSDALPPAAATQLPRLKLAVTPPLDAVQATLDAALLVGEIRVRIRLRHDAEGAVLDASLETGSGDDDVDDALLAWARQARVMATAAGEGVINVRLETGNVAWSTPIVVKEASTWGIEQALRDSHLVRLDASVVVAVDDKGKPSNPMVVPKTRDEALDAAIKQWALRNGYAPGRPGVIRLNLRLTVNVTGNARIMDIRVEAPAGVQIIDHPGMGDIARKLSNSYLDEVGIEIDIDHDASGSVTAARVIGSIPSMTVTQAIEAWAKGLRLRPGAAGTSRIRLIIAPE